MSQQTEKKFEKSEQPEKEFENNDVAFLKKKKAALIKMMAISSGIDLVLSIPEAATMFLTFGGSIIVEEIVETVISSVIGSTEEYDVNITWWDRAKGFIPVPGITALSLRCWRELKLVNKELAKFKE